jgi:hypothetical protein
MPQTGNRVTPEEIVAAILVELEQRTATGYYTNYVPNVFKVYLYREDFRDLLPLKDKIRDEAIRALHEDPCPSPRRSRGSAMKPWAIG